MDASKKFGRHLKEQKGAKHMRTLRLHVNSKLFACNNLYYKGSESCFFSNIFMRLFE